MAYLYPAYELMNNKMEDFEFSLIMNIDDEDYEHIMSKEFIFVQFSLFLSLSLPYHFS